MARRRKRSRKWISWLIILILLIAAGVVVFLVWDNYFKEDKEGKDSEESEVVVAVLGNQDNSKVEKEDKQPEVIEKKEIVQYEGSNPNQNSNVTGALTYAGVVGKNLVIRVNIDQYLSGGNCKLSLITDGVVVHEEFAGISESATTSTCEGFNVPVAGLASGTYQILINVSAGEKMGKISGEVKI